MTYFIDSLSIAYPHLCTNCSPDNTRDKFLRNAAIAAHLGVASTVISVALAVFAFMMIGSPIAAAGIAAASAFLFVIGHDWCHLAKNVISLIGPSDAPANLTALLRLTDRTEQAIRAKLGDLEEPLTQHMWSAFPQIAVYTVMLSSIRECIREENGFAAV